MNAVKKPNLRINSILIVDPEIRQYMAKILNFSYCPLKNMYSTIYIFLLN